MKRTIDIVETLAIPVIIRMYVDTRDGDVQLDRIITQNGNIELPVASLAMDANEERYFRTELTSQARDIAEDADRDDEEHRLRAASDAEADR